MKELENIKKSYRSYLENTHDIHDVESIIEGFKTDRDKEAFNQIAKEEWENCERDSLTTGAELGRYQREAQLLLDSTNRRKQILFRKTLRIAASIAALICIAYISTHLYQKNSLANIEYRLVSTTYSEKKQVSLPDGSVVTLNSCSKLRYPISFEEDERLIELEGEGLFNVARDKSKPFIVKVDNFSVRVLGTVFDVKSYKNDDALTVEVESGRVQVDTPEAMMRLKASERITINRKSGEFIKNIVDPSGFAIWRYGGLYFKDSSIHDVAQELERYYGCKITFKEGQEFLNRISGLHDNSNLINILNDIEYVTGIHYSMDGNNILLYKD